MSYPPVRFTAPAGEHTAVLRPATAPPALTIGTGASVHHLATGATTDGAFGLYRWEMPERPGGASPHFPRTLSESFYVLDGSVRLFDGRSWVDAVPGDFLHVPPGGVHGFRNESGKSATMLLLFTPGAPREEYFAE